ncbi:MAG: metallophosphoesterase family protein [Anaerolineae bacterium]|nr:metallophosphoesterase family protein [Anaerolineae bacterium]
MRILVLSDIHGNHIALKAVLKAAADEGYDTIYCLGDLVGYGPNPDECVSTIRELGNLSCVMGNHDAAVSGYISIESFNQDAQDSVHWVVDHLSPENLLYLNHLPDLLVKDGCTVTHGSPRNPIWEYILDSYTARMNFEFFETQFCFIGHSHQPIIFRYGMNDGILPNWYIPINGETFTFTNERVIMNPGSVGQPRDRDPRASFGIFDAENQSWTVHRVSYNIEKVQQLIMESGLPERNALRLVDGW